MFSGGLHSGHIFHPTGSLLLSLPSACSISARFTKKTHTFTHLTNRKTAWRVAHLWHHCWLFSPTPSELSFTLYVPVQVKYFPMQAQNGRQSIHFLLRFFEMTKCFCLALFEFWFFPHANFWHYSGSSGQLIFQPVNVGTVNCCRCWSRAQIRNALAFGRLWFNEQ